MPDEVPTFSGYDISVLKIDVEGVEDQALAPLFEMPADDRPDILMLEHAHRDAWDEDILERLLVDGYEMQFETRMNAILRRIGGNG